PFEPNDLTPRQKAEALAELQKRHAETCPHCTVQTGIQNIVFGEGDPDADLMFIGEGPGAEEDRLGRPFVGRSGQLLDKQIGAMGLAREQVYIANIVKTRPPGNRVPTPDEATLCAPFLYEQIQIIGPTAIVTLGATAAKYLLLEPRLAITRERGTWRDYRGIALMPTFHPAYLLRQFTVENRRRVWDDLQKVMEKLGLELPKK
ncbi:MAG: uracil-DNA glycosylase, partial [Planctomycetota bacterium]